MSQTTRKAAEWWSDPPSEATETQWVRVPGVLENMNRRATGDPAIDLINHSAGLLASLSGHCAVTTSVSLSMVWTLPRMRSKVQGKTAQAEGLGGLSYEVVDLNGAKFSGETYAALRRRKRDVAKRVPLKRIAKSRSRERS